jgi:hypothetical protein
LDNHGKYFVTLGLNAGKKSGSLTTMVGTGGEHIARCARKMQKEGVRSTSVDLMRLKNSLTATELYHGRAAHL